MIHIHISRGQNINFLTRYDILTALIDMINVQVILAQYRELSRKIRRKKGVFYFKRPVQN